MFDQIQKLRTHREPRALTVWTQKYGLKTCWTDRSVLKKNISSQVILFLNS